MDKLLDLLRAQRAKHLDWLRQLGAIPSVSTEDEHRTDVRQAVDEVCRLCMGIGLSAAVCETGGHPLVVAEHCHAAGAPTCLVYGHADVQPMGDPARWNTPPFEPTVVDDWMYCRGAADDKGPLLVYLRAAEAWLSGTGKLPINLKILIEAEEEVGSPNLRAFLEQNRERLACDTILISDTGLFQDHWPTITTGTRGLCYKEVVLSGPTGNLHSGLGGPVVNPANALARLIATLHDDQGRVNIPGFYDDVVEPTAEERAQLAALPFDDQQYARDLGVPSLHGEPGWNTLELGTVRPTLDVNGIYGGYMEPGSNTIIPARAGAKISMRLVPNQRAATISRLFNEAVRARCPAGVRCEIIDHALAEPYYATPAGPAMQAAQLALRESFGRDVALLRSGGSLPIVNTFRDLLGVNSILIGLDSPNCNAHGPNEKICLSDLDRGAETMVRLFGYLAETH